MARAASGAAPPVLDAIARVSSADLNRFLSRQRWFAAKSGSLDGVVPVVAPPIVAPWGDGRFANMLVSVDVNGCAQRYQVPVAVAAALPNGAPASAMLETTAAGIVYDAMHDPEFRAGLVAAIVSGASAPFGGATFTIDPAQRTRIDPSAETRLGSAEQSNTSIVVGCEAVIKLLRLLAPGIHPEVEIAERLTVRAHFGHTPALLATMRIEEAGVVTTTGIAQVYLPQSTDAWTFAIERSTAYFAAPRGDDLPNPFAADAKRLGRVTRRMHEALASDRDDLEFAPEEASEHDLERWADRAHATALGALALLGDQLSSPRFPKIRVPEAQALVERRDRYLEWIDDVADEIDDDLGMRARVHGDYHLGQVLHTADDDFMIIDFEGEPSKPIDERREKTSPLRDVAGMLRSIAYAASTLAASVEKTVDMPTRELRAGRWERDVRTAFLDGYLEPVASGTRGLLPRRPDSLTHLTALFEAEKAFYELSYELNNRPSWAWIPMRGIAKLLAR